jgi:ribosomal protein S8
MISTTNDLMARLNNGLDRKLTTILVLNSKKTKSILKFLCEHGFIYNFIILNKKYCKVFLKYNKISLPFCKFKIISKTS